MLLISKTDASVSKAFVGLARVYYRIPKNPAIWIVYRQSASYVSINDFENHNISNIQENLLKLINEKPLPILINEWQENTIVWDATKKTIDKTNKKGINIILTGWSSYAYSDKISHSGVGRIFKIWITTLTFDEIYNTNDKISFRSLFEGKDIQDCVCQAFGRTCSIVDNLERIAYGCWPETIDKDIQNNSCTVGYIEDLVSTSFKSFNSLLNDKKTTMTILKAMATMCSCTFDVSKILNNLKGNVVSRNTLNKYIKAFDSVSLFFYIDSFASNIKSKTKIMLKPKTYFADASIPATLLGLTTPEELKSNRSALEFLFENLVMKDLKVYAQALRGNLYYFCNKNGFEINAIFENGRDWGAIQIILGENEIEKSARKLIFFRDNFELREEFNTKPKFLMVICGAISRSYIREDGVIVCPPTVLGV